MSTKIGKALEKRIEKLYGGFRSRSSGAAKGRKGDVEISFAKCQWLAECKATEKKSISLEREVWEKIEQEAAAYGWRPKMFLEFQDPDDPRNILTLVVREVNDDVEMIENLEMQLEMYERDGSG